MFVFLVEVQILGFVVEDEFHLIGRHPMIIRRLEEVLTECQLLEFILGFIERDSRQCQQNLYYINVFHQNVYSRIEIVDLLDEGHYRGDDDEVYGDVPDHEVHDQRGSEIFLDGVAHVEEARYGDETFVAVDEQLHDGVECLFVEDEVDIVDGGFGDVLRHQIQAIDEHTQVGD